MSIFAIGDLHLAMDPRVEKPMDIFGEEWVDHAEKLKTSWLRHCDNMRRYFLGAEIRRSAGRL